jgi:tRNA A-37 threonylcarbamoyl transferase component Bud32
MVEDRLNSLLLAWQEQHLQGRDVPAAELCRDRPDLAGELERRIAVLRRMNGLLQSGDTAPASGAAPNSGDGQTALSHEAPTQTGSPGGETPPGAPSFPGPVPGYEILGELGRGGMGVVCKARQKGLNRTVALKMIGGPARADSEAAVRFLREAETAARLRHPHVVQVYEFGTHEGRPYFSLEYVEGGSLADRLRGEPQPPAAAAQLVRTLAGAIHYAHEQGVVHRDLKPANILMQNAECRMQNENQFCTLHSAFCIPKITDFGLAKRLSADAGLTQSGSVLGTPSYMAPEQATGSLSRIGPAADVYALGAILYELLTGRPPFRSAEVMDTLYQVVHQEPVPPSRLQPAVPRDLETICLKCLEKDPSRRYATAAELGDDLGRFLRGEPVRARRVGLVERTVKWVRRRPAAALAGLVALLAVAAAAGGYRLWLQAEEARGQVERDEQARADARRVKTAYCTSFIRRRGLPEGVGPLPAAEARHLAVVCKVYRRGGQIERVDFVNGRGRLTGKDPPFVDLFLDQHLSAAEARRPCSFRFSRDARGRVMEESAFDRAGRPVWKLHYSSPTTAHYQDPQGLPSPRTVSGAAYLQFVWSEEGFPVEVWYLDRLGQRKPNRDGVYGERREFNPQGLRTRVTYLDAKGRPTLNGDGVAGYAGRRDARGRWVESTYFGLDGRPAAGKHGFCRKRKKRDAQGNLQEVAYFGADGKPVWHKDGNHLWRARYDEWGNEIGRAFFGLAGEPVLLTRGYHRWAAQFDARGNEVGCAFYGLRGEPIALPAGYHRRAAKFDARGNQIEQAYYGPDGKPVWHKDGNHRWRARFDDCGNEVECAFYGVASRCSCRAATTAGPRNTTGAATRSSWPTSAPTASRPC